MFRCHRRLTSALLVSVSLTLASGASDVQASESGFSSEPALTGSPVTWAGHFGLQATSGRIHLSERARTGDGGTVSRHMTTAISLSGTTEASRLKSLIAGAEAGSLGYDAVHYGANRRPLIAPTRLTLGQILDWVDATPGQPHAIGRYQFIPSTLRDLIARTGAPLETLFNATLQDRFADVLLHDAGYKAFVSGTLHRTGFMNNLAAIWAGLPTSSGRSAYHGYAGNRATISWTEYDRHMAAIFD